MLWEHEAWLVPEHPGVRRRWELSYFPLFKTVPIHSDLLKYCEQNKTRVQAGLSIIRVQLAISPSPFAILLLTLIITPFSEAKEFLNYLFFFFT